MKCKKFLALLVTAVMLLAMLPVMQASAATYTYEQPTSAEIITMIDEFLASASFGEAPGLYPEGVRTYLTALKDELTANTVPSSQAKISELLADENNLAILNYDNVPEYTPPQNAEDCQPVIDYYKALLKDGNNDDNIWGKWALATRLQEYYNNNDVDLNAHALMALNYQVPQLQYTRRDIMPGEFTVIKTMGTDQDENPYEYAQSNAFDGNPRTRFQGRVPSSLDDMENPDYPLVGRTIEVHFHEPTDLSQISIMNASSNSQGRFNNYRMFYQKEGNEEWIQIGGEHSNGYSLYSDPWSPVQYYDSVSQFEDSDVFNIILDSSETAGITKFKFVFDTSHWSNELSIPEIRFRRDFSPAQYGFAAAAQDTFASDSTGYTLEASAADPENGWLTGWSSDPACSTPLPETALVRNGKFEYKANTQAAYRKMANKIDLGQDGVYFVSALLNQSVIGTGGDKHASLSLGNSSGAVYRFGIQNGDNEYKATLPTGGQRNVFGTSYYHFRLWPGSGGDAVASSPNTYPMLISGSGSTFYRIISKIVSSKDGMDTIYGKLVHMNEEFTRAQFESTVPGDWDFIYEVASNEQLDTIGLTAQTYNNNFYADDIYVGMIPPESFTLPDYIAVAEGASTSVSAACEPEGASLVGVEWSTEDPNIATVDATGKVTGVSNGRTKLTLTLPSSGVSASTEVIVDGEVLFTEDFSSYGEGTVLNGQNSPWTVSAEGTSLLAEPQLQVVGGAGKLVRADAVGGSGYVPQTVRARASLSSPINLMEDGNYLMSFRLKIGDNYGGSQMNLNLGDKITIGAFGTTNYNGDSSYNEQSTYLLRVNGADLYPQPDTIEAVNLNGYGKFMDYDVELITSSSGAATLQIKCTLPANAGDVVLDDTYEVAFTEGDEIDFIEAFSQNMQNHLAGEVDDISIVKLANYINYTTAYASDVQISSLQSGEVTFRSNVINQTNAPFEVMGLVAVYDANGNFVGYGTGESAIAEAGSAGYAEVTVNVPSTGRSVKAFYWESLETLKPVMKPSNFS